MKAPPMSLSFATMLQDFFCQRLINQRNARPRTIASYRDTFRILLCYVAGAGDEVMVKLNAHAAGNGGYSQGCNLYTNAPVPDPSARSLIELSRTLRSEPPLHQVGTLQLTLYQGGVRQDVKLISFPVGPAASKSAPRVRIRSPENFASVPVRHFPRRSDRRRGWKRLLWVYLGSRAGLAAGSVRELPLAGRGRTKSDSDRARPRRPADQRNNSGQCHQYPTCRRKMQMSYLCKIEMS